MGIKEHLTNICVSPPQSLHKHLEVLHLIHLGDPRIVPATQNGPPNTEGQDGKWVSHLMCMLDNVNQTPWHLDSMWTHRHINHNTSFLLATTLNLPRDRTEEFLFLVWTQ